MQADYDAGSDMAVIYQATVEAYAPKSPKCFEISQQSIIDWGSSVGARAELPVLVRTLVHSTGKDLTRVDFPGGDASQSPGWDGLVESSIATAWVPRGPSRWELSCEADPRNKATDDYKKRTRKSDRAEIRDSTFIFVTPQRWKKKNDWQNQRLAEEHWGDVRVYDASDLEQWIEQAPPGQIWFAEATGQPTKGLKSLARCWDFWQASSELSLGLCLFDDAISHSRDRVQRWLQSGTGATLSIAADSNEEALAFLYALWKSGQAPSFQGEKVIVFERTDLFSRLLQPGADLIPVITGPELERELSPYLKHCTPIIIRNSQPPGGDHDIVLKPLCYGVFRSALEKLGWEHDHIERYRRESGGSLTVLRRRLSLLPAVRTPAWVDHPDFRQLMAPIALAGSWDCSSEFDKLFLSSLAGGRPQEAIEGDIANLLLCSDTPVWCIGSRRGVRSKIDVLFAVSSAITVDLLIRYFDLAAAVLAEDNPALDLPDEQRWQAGIYDRRRECSGALRWGMADTLILLAVYHDDLFRHCSGIDLPGRIDQLVRGMLEPLTARKLESQSDCLPAYAEAAPETFLDLIEKDLDRGPESEVLQLLRPIDDDMAPCPREGLLDALETLAWSGKTLARTVDVLAKLSLHQHDDQWAKTPESCLGAIFRSWLPQTSVGIDGRIQVFERVMHSAPQVAWRLCYDQLKPGVRAGEFSTKPRWRQDSNGYGQGCSQEDDERFQLRCCEHLLARDQYSKEEMGDLVGLIRHIPSNENKRVWQLIDRWQKDASEEDRAWLRDRIRYDWLRSRPVEFRKHPQEAENMECARAAYALLTPKDPVLKFRWIFCDDQSSDEHDVPQEVILGCKRPGESAVSVAVAEIYSETGIDGILRLASSVNCQRMLGMIIHELGLKVIERSTLIRSAMEGEFYGKCDGLVQALLVNMSDTHGPDTYSCLKNCLSAEKFSYVLRLAPFGRTTWKMVQEIGDKCTREYWQSVPAPRRVGDSSECNEAVRQFMNAGRPMDALGLAARYHELFDAKGLCRVLESVASITGSDRGPRFGDEAIEYIGRVIAKVRKSRQIAERRIASIELRLFDALEHYGYTPALDAALRQDPRLYAALVDRASNMDEDGQARDPRVREDLLAGGDDYIAWLVLRKKRLLPRASEQEPASAANLLAWVQQVQKLCEARGRREEADYWIGRLLSASGPGDDGISPCEVVRDVLEEILSEAVRSGFQNGIWGAGGVRASSLRGIEEQELEAQYRSWSEALQYSHPKVSLLLRQVAEEYRKAAKFFEQDANLSDQFLNSA